MKKQKIVDEKLLKFISVGIVNTLIGMAIMFCLYNIAGFSYWVSSAANYILVSILSYLLNRNFTFGHKGSMLKSILRFAVNIAVCYLIAYGVAKPLMIHILSNSTVTVQENIAMLVGMCIFTGLNYLGQRFFVFGGTDMDYRETYEKWLKSEHISDDEREQLQGISDEEVFDAFYKKLEFGTAGMRGVMGLGTNRMNKYTVRMAAKGLAEMLGEGSTAAVAYDTRHNSKDLAEEAAGVLAAAGIKVFLFDRYSPVPLLSFTIRELGCDGGAVITASHNLKIYNGFKVYDGTGCQMSVEDAGKIADNIDNLADELNIETAGLDDKNISYIGQEIVDKFMDAVEACKAPVDEEAARGLKIVYTPIHGSGRPFITEILKRTGFTDVNLVKEQAEYDGDFPTVVKPNPEEPEVFHIAEKQALNAGADIIVGTDPDCDRIGIGVNHKGKITYLKGNHIGTLLVDFLGRMRNAEGKTLITSIVTGDMGEDVAKSYGADTVRTYTGFKNLGGAMNHIAQDKVFMAYEESFGYLVGTHIRDKDAVSATMMVCQMAAYWKQQGMTLVDVMDMLFEKYGYYLDDQSSYVFEGADGAAKMAGIMKQLRETDGAAFSRACSIKECIDYLDGVGDLEPADVLKYIFEDGSWIAARPSGTEPKIKFYYCIKGNDRSKSESTRDLLKSCVEDLVGDK